jgi:hypothetical protein
MFGLFKRKTPEEPGKEIVDLMVNRILAFLCAEFPGLTTSQQIATFTEMFALELTLFPQLLRRINRMDCWHKLVGPVTCEMSSTYVRAESSLEFADSQMERVTNRMGEYSKLDASEIPERFESYLLAAAGRPELNIRRAVAQHIMSALDPDGYGKIIQTVK